MSLHWFAILVKLFIFDILCSGYNTYNSFHRKLPILKSRFLVLIAQKTLPTKLTKTVAIFSGYKVGAENGA